MVFLELLHEETLHMEWNGQMDGYTQEQLDINVEIVILDVVAR